MTKKKTAKAKSPAKEETGTSPLAEELKEKWGKLVARLAAREELTTAEQDQECASLLEEYHGQGMPVRAIAPAISTKTNKVGKTRVDQLLRYHRYSATLSTGVDKVAEGTFRTYWEQVRDRARTRGKRKIDPVYEEECFATIRAKIAAKEKAMKPPRRRKRKLPTPEDLCNAQAVVREVRQVYKSIRPTLKKLRDLLGRDQATCTPDLMSNAAAVLDKAFKELLATIRVVDQANEEHPGE